jgi:hypothetical protein
MAHPVTWVERHFLRFLRDGPFDIVGSELGCGVLVSICCPYNPRWCDILHNRWVRRPHRCDLFARVAADVLYRMYLPKDAVGTEVIVEVIQKKPDAQYEPGVVQATLDTSSMPLQLILIGPPELS